MTLAEWAELPEEEPGELVAGWLEEEEVPDYVHELAVAWLIHALYAWVGPRGGLVAGSDAKFAVRGQQGRKPDLSMYFADSPKPPRRGLVRTPPDVAVEVISPKPRDVRRDRVEKLDDYATFGVRFYWILDPEIRSLEIYELGSDGRYVHALGASAGKIPIPGCADLELDLDSLWAQIDRLPTEGSSDA